MELKKKYLHNADLKINLAMNMNQSEIISRTTDFIKERFESEGSGHDWWHIYRVLNLAKSIAAKEGGDRFIIEMASLLHDLDDWKISPDLTVSLAGEWLDNSKVDETEKEKILEVIGEVSFKGAKVNTPATSIESMIVQDADRLDAIGAIGIARAFAYGGSKGRLIYDPVCPPVFHSTFEDYRKSNSATINHFYEKLLLLKDRMQTKTGRKIAEQRHKILEDFLNAFFLEWDVKN